MAALHEIVTFLDKELSVASFSDDSNNGLQVENSGQVRKICCGVDATLAFFEAAAERGADLAVCHHGLSWGDSLKRLTHLNYRRVSALMRHDMALYACHLPLDAHPRLGTNARLARALGVTRLRPFGEYHGQVIGFAGSLPSPIPYAQFKERVRRVTGGDLRSMDFGRPRVRTVAVISGGGSDMLEEAARKGIDVFVSGEPKLPAYHVARECGIHAVFAGHYATEVFGVQALAGLLARRFRVAAEFIAMETPY
jgi:dinuclear metal center YbgI/SA1388 family protein